MEGKTLTMPINDYITAAHNTLIAYAIGYQHGSGSAERSPAPEVTWNTHGRQEFFSQCHAFGLPVLDAALGWVRYLATQELPSNMIAHPEYAARRHEVRAAIREAYEAEGEM